MTMSVIHFHDPSGDSMVSREPQTGIGNFQTGSQVIVEEGQVAIFYRDGQAFDEFGPGRHTITTANLPLISRIVGSGYDRSPFTSHVMYVATRIFNDLGWGTKTPVNFSDTRFGIVPVRAYGLFSIRVSNPRQFLQTLVGTLGRQYTDDIVGYMRTIIVSALTDQLAKGFTSIVDLPGRYGQISAGIAGAVRPQFAQFGIDLIEVVVEAITPPPSVQEMIERAAGIRIQDVEAYRGVAAADAMRDAAKGGGGGGTASDGMATGLGMAMGLAAAKEMLGQAPAAPAAATGQKTVEERLRSLKRMFDEGLITREEFDKTKGEILDDL
jgi:membrane protease subunit (stomatin/prohibitin family)